MTLAALQVVLIIAGALPWLSATEPAATVPALAPGSGSGVEGCPWLAPVTAEVTDGFRPPSHPFGPGNRGLEYGTDSGEIVAAVAGGAVGFVGPVAGLRWAVVEHPSGLRSTYGPLATVSVVRGQTIGAGQPVGTTEGRLLLTARAGDRYVDPTPLLAGRCGRARLIPEPGPAGAG